MKPRREARQQDSSHKGEWGTQFSSRVQGAHPDVQKKQVLPDAFEHIQDIFPV